jgi:hypothetical protein
LISSKTGENFEELIERLKKIVCEPSLPISES